MVSRVIFLPRAVAARWRPTAGSALISIYDRDEPPLEVQIGWTEVLRLRFHDADVARAGIELFNPEQAREVIEFAKRHAAAPELVVHCKMGQSRSAAVAMFLSESLGVPCFKEQTPVDFFSWPGYNRKVYAVLANEAYGPVGSAFKDNA